MKSKFLKKLGEAVFGRREEAEPQKQEPVVASEPASGKSTPLISPDYVRMMRKLISRRAPRRGRNQFADKRMTRGVQKALEAKQRPGRLAFIFESMRQGNRIAKKRRTAYVKRRTARWRGVVEANMPRMFAAELAKQGL
jgi:hypothetical protein